MASPLYEHGNSIGASIPVGHVLTLGRFDVHMYCTEEVPW